MIVRIEGPLGSYTGKLGGGVPFVNGVSQRPLTEKEARRIGININIYDVETGLQAGLLKPVDHIPAAPLVTVAPEPEVEKPVEVAAPVEEVVAKPDLPLYTKEDLEIIASEKGIKGVREIAAVYNVKGVQISQLISGILGAQGN